MSEERKDSFNHVLKYTGIFGGVQGLNILMSLVRNKILAYLLGAGGMGLMALFNSSVNFISQATTLGIPFSAVRNISELYDEDDEARMKHYIKVIRGWCLLTALLGAVFCVLAGPLLSNYTFSWGNHTFHFILLAPAVALMAITGGETAILKGTRQLKALATIQLKSVFVTLLMSLPLFYFFRESAIVPVIVLIAFVTMLLTIGYSYRLYPLDTKDMSSVLGEGKDMVKLGVAFIMAGIIGSGAEIVIRSYLNVAGNLHVVGLYNAGFMLTITYAGMVFSAMETDYFPRLSAVGNDREALCDMVNKQIEVSLLLLSPMLALLIIFMPIIIPLLYTSEFLPVVSMASIAVFSMYIKSVSLPICYTTLAKGESLAFFILESSYYLVLVVLIIFGYQRWGLVGTGVALTLSYVYEIIVVCIYTYFRYGYRLSLSVLQLIGIQLPIGISVYLTTFLDNLWLSWFLGGLLCFVSMSISFYILRQKASLWRALQKKVSQKLRHKE